MNRIILLALATTQICLAQVNKEVGNFSKIKVFDRITVVLEHSAEERVEVTGTRSDEVEVINKNGELKIRMSLKKLMDGEEVTAKVYYKSVTNIDANEGSFVSSEDTFAQKYIYVSAQEGASVRVAIRTDSADIRAATGGIVDLRGSSRSMDVKLGAGGILKAKDVQATDASVDVKAGGEAAVRSSGSVSAKVTAGGKITIYGNPKNIARKTTLGGKIEEIRD